MSFENVRMSRRAAGRLGAGLVAGAALRPRFGAAADQWDEIRSICNADVAKIGASVMVLTPQQTVFAESFGNAFLQVPSIFASASMGLSAVALLALVDRGVFTLDTAIGAFLPEFTGDKAGITLRQCLSHRSGIDDPGDLLVPSEIALIDTLDDEVTLAAGKPLLFKPGSKFLLGGMGYQAAGRAAEVASDTAWPFLFQSAIDDQLGVGFTFGETSDPRLAAGAAGTISSYAAVLSVLLNNGVANGAQVLSPAMIKELRSDQIGHDLTATPTAETGGAVAYGLGWWIERTNGHGLGTLINCAGSFGTFPWIDFEKNYAAIVTMQDKEETGRNLVAKIRPKIEKLIA